ncbi:aminopeptidase Q-like [Odontomachus brunneus]|uniref:aminopeptidase Q-like n=1 Tax=Odontomachus brunneus TaxID=486640 RepID=UPI0013F24BC4|nr:aminopeptidase Q-like [Odontomachus brunneus]XP_032687768.1 aminopeptidase Q-like [Odontomachus brunneus]
MLCIRSFFGILSTSNRARTVFPCWDEPEIYMNYEIVIRHFEQYQVISNMPVQKLLHESNNMSLTYFHISKPITSSQVAIIMLDNMIQHTLEDEYLWCKLHITVEETNILNEIYYIKRNLTTNFKVEDRIMKTDHIVIPNFPLQVIGSLGVIIYREHSIKFDTNTDFPGRKINIYKFIGDAMAREVLGQVICPSYQWLIKILASFLSHFTIFQVSLRSYLCQNIVTFLQVTHFILLYC